MSNFWKFYCWMFATFTIPIALVEIANGYKWRLVDFLTVPSLVLSFLVVYSYAYKARVFSRNTWKVFWWYNITWSAITILFASPPFDKYFPDFLKGYYYFEPNYTQPDLFFMIFGLIFLLAFIPVYFANFVLAFDEKYLDTKGNKKK